MMANLFDWLETFKYDRPVLARISLSIFGLTAVLILFLMLPASPMLQAMGITSIQTRVMATANAIYWSSRATINQGGTETHTEQFGNLEGIDPKGKLVISIPEYDKWVKKTVTLANAELTDLYGAAEKIGSLRTENARFDIYKTDLVVVWIRNAPLNVKLIESGVAKPDTSPMSNIFDIAFATYYWSLAKGTTPPPAITPN